jgi:hypothetical protein
MKFAFADPPYLGTAKRTYGKVHPEAAAYDDPETHRRLIERLQDEFPDGWALSLHEPSLRDVLSMCPRDVRVAAWISAKPKFPPGIAVCRHWEPVIWMGGRGGAHRTGDFIVTTNGGSVRAENARPERGGQANRNFASRVDKGRDFFGSKPAAFCDWIFALLGAERGDEFHDLFPGSGAVSAAWARFCGQQPDLPLTPLEAIAAAE